MFKILLIHLHEWAHRLLDLIRTDTPPPTDTTTIQRVPDYCIAHLDVVPAQWFFTVYPPQNTHWNQYLLSLISLHHKDGFPKPKKQFPEATHEILVLALDPSLKPKYNRPLRTIPLTPHNYAIQFTATDEDAIQIAHDIAFMFHANPHLFEMKTMSGGQDVIDWHVHQWIENFKNVVQS